MKEYAFVDMHMHTIFSDEELCDMSIEQLLQKCQEKAEQLGGDCVISIADHNTILGVKKARELMAQYPERYKNVRLINGVEFTTDLCEMESVYGKKVFTRCHTLAYNYDENDPELTAYSLITHKHFTANDNIGMQICAARRIVNENFGVTIPFTKFLPLLKLKRTDDFKAAFVQIALQELQANNVTVKSQQINILIQPYIMSRVTDVREAAALGRITISEMAQMVKNAGGELVIAHPSFINVSRAGIEYCAQKYGVRYSDIYDPQNDKYKKGTLITYLKKPKIVLTEFIETFESICGYKIAGLEAFYGAGFDRKMFDITEQICAERGLCLSCGSDYHGEHLHRDKRIGGVFNDEVYQTYLEQQKNLPKVNIPFHIQGIGIVEHLLDKNGQEKQKAIIKDISGYSISRQQFGDLVHQTILKKLAKRNQSQEPQLQQEKKESEIKLEEKLAYAHSMVKKFQTILSRETKQKKVPSLLLKLNLFAENIIKGLKEFKQEASQDPSILANPQYQEFLTQMSNIGQMYQVISQRSPHLIQTLKHDMKYYYHKNYLALDNLIGIEFPAPIKQDDRSK
ncbi:MAG: hypothetical protein E7378_01255 [Clostridiales bacterium]|nr:hypothetical protein [Clostridiales bacterium]